jgi:hypothetical protein
MKPQRWRRLESLFHPALEREPPQRAAFLAEACADDPALRAEVESLIAAYDQAGSFIETPAINDSAISLIADEGNSLDQ